MTDSNRLFQSGTFFVGCNFWASHAGTAMWSDWRPDVVEGDLKVLSDAGLQVLRVFPLWPDFQPIQLLRAGYGQPKEFSPLDNPDGVSAVMMDRFTEFARLAEKYQLCLVVGLVTGWMSGRLFVPPALEGRNVLTDPMAIRWQVRFVKHFVRRFKGSSAVLAWDLGNECNCMAPATRDEAWAWTSAIVNAVRSVDSGRSVVSGMHSLSPSPEAAWKTQDQGELTDVLTTHPYPIFTPHCDADPINTFRSCFHAAAESRFYGDIGHKPCFAEEVGTLGPMVASESIAADYIRTVLFNLWTHDCLGLLWWCGFDQSHLAFPPYDWCAMEQELGLFRADRSAKPVVAELTKFRHLIEQFPYKNLPPRLTDGVCVLTDGQDSWGVAYAAFLLAKQAGVDITFQYEDQPLRDAPVYLLPNLAGLPSHHRSTWLNLLDRVRAGATLYISQENGFLTHFEEATGLRLLTRERRNGPCRIELTGLEGSPNLITNLGVRLNLEAVRAHILGREADGNPAFSVCDYGKGKIFFLAVPAEMELIRTPGSFFGPQALAAWQIYRRIFDSVPSQRAVKKNVPHVALTEHPLDDRRRVVVMVNCSPRKTEATFTLAPGWQLEKFLHGQGQAGAVTLNPNDAAVFTIAR